VSGFPTLRAYDWKDRNKTEFNWTRMVTARFQQQDVIASIEPVTQTAATVTYGAVATANANAQTAGYVQADVQSIATLANALKTAFNALVAALQTQTNALVADDGATITALNAALDALSTTPVQQ
jgi:hypothetical protein